MGRFDNLRSAVAELIDESRDEEVEPRGYQGESRGGQVLEAGLLEHDPPRDLEDYWYLYKHVGVIQQAIDNFATEVIEPGWYITADDEETAEELTEYFTDVGVINTKQDVNASKLIETMIVEREVRGTVFLEKVTDSQDRNQALYPLENDTITVYTKPGKSMLPAPDDDSAVPLDPGLSRGPEHSPITEDGELGAFVQFDDFKPVWRGVQEVAWTRDQIIHWPRDADIGQARGSSRVATIANRAEGLLRKLQNNDDAIESKAWPQIIFNMGTEENPWTEDEVSDFIDNYDDENLEPGTMVAVSGDVSTEEFAGETADIADDIETDINMIMSGLPGPVYATGGWSQNVAPAVAQAQQRQFRKEVKQTRREVEDLLTPYLQEVADDYNLDAADSVELHLGRPQGEVAPEDVQGSIIQYQSDAGNGGQGNQEPVVPISSDDVVTSPEDIEDQQESSNETTSGSDDNSTARGRQTNSARQARRASNSGGRASGLMTAELGDASVPHDHDELADPRLVSVTGEVEAISGTIEEILTTARSIALDEVEARYGDDVVIGPSQFDRISRIALTEAMDEVDPDYEEQIESVVERTVDTIGQQNHSPQIDTVFGARHRQQSRLAASIIESETEEATQELLNDIETYVTRSSQQGESFEQIRSRVEERWDTSSIEQRARIIAHMEAKNAVNTTKLREYESHQDVAGVEVINPCGPTTTPLCRDLACEGENARAMFDDEQSVADQLMDSTSDDNVFERFDPLPLVPPYHFGCRSEFVAVPRTEQ